jgi:hypothetical protein
MKLQFPSEILVFYLGDLQDSGHINSVLFPEDRVLPAISEQIYFTLFFLQTIHYANETIIKTTKQSESQQLFAQNYRVI